MKIDMVQIETLKPSEYNPRKISEHDRAELKKSLEKYGFVEPIVANRAPGREGIIIGGHQRFHAAKEMGMAQVPVFWVEIAELAREKELNVRLNRNQGAWDYGLLEDFFKTDELLEWGFEKVEIDFKERKVREETEPTPEPPEIPRTKAGDLYELGGVHRLLCGDATRKEDFEKLMGSDKARLVFTDPPYSVNYESTAGNSYSEGKYGSDGKIFNDDKDPEEALRFYKKILKNLYVFTADDAPIYWWFANKMNWINRLAWIDTEWFMAQIIIWLKETMIFSLGQDYHRCYEPCMFGWKKGKAHFTNKKIANLRDVILMDKNDFSEFLDVWYERRDKTNEYVHPTQKPVQLARRALRKSSVEGDFVLDAFGGSGSTLIACEQMKRKARLMELDPKYCDVIVKRWCNFTNEDPEKIFKGREA